MTLRHGAGQQPWFICGQFKNQQLSHCGMIRFLNFHLPDHEHRDRERQQAGEDQTRVLNRRCNDRITMALFGNFAAVLFQLFMACVNGRLLPVEL